MGATEKGDRVYDYIVEYKKQHDGNCPSHRQILYSCGISSTSMVHYHLHRLADQGLIAIINRRIEVTGGRWVAPEEER